MLKQSKDTTADMDIRLRTQLEQQEHGSFLKPIKTINYKLFAGWFFTRYDMISYLKAG